MDTKRIVEGLNDLLAKNYDAEKGFKEAAEKTENPVFKSLYRNKSSQRYSFGHEIKEMINEMNGEVDKGTSVAGDAHRAWMNFRNFFSNNNEESLLEEIERGEQAALKDYDQFLNMEENMPHRVKSAISRQRNSVARTLNKMEALEQQVS